MKLLTAVACAALAHHAAAESEAWPLPHDAHAHHHHAHKHYKGDRPGASEPPLRVSPEAGDPLRTRTPAAGAPPLLPLQWGTVNPTGWIRDWAVTASEGAVSPMNAWFAHGKGIPIGPDMDHALSKQRSAVACDFLGTILRAFL